MNRPSLLGLVRGLVAAVRRVAVVMIDPNRPTREGLRSIAQVLRDAGWDAPAADGLTDNQLERLRAASERFLRPDDLRVIQAVVADRRTVAEVAAELNRSPAELSQQLARALEDLARFAHAANPTVA